MEKSNLEYLLEQLINGEGLTDFVPRSRMEEHLLAIINNTGIENLGSPRSRAEVLLQVLAEQGVGGGGAIIEISTAEEMDALLVAENVGKIYKYIGETNEKYTNGVLYMVEEDV